MKFTISAPGKVILHGEHSVVYGKPAIAGVVDIRNYLTLETTNEEKITLYFDAVKNPLPINLIVFNDFLEQQAQLFGVGTPSASIDHAKFLIKISEFILTIPNSTNEFDIKVLEAVIYLLTGTLLYNNFTKLTDGINLHLKSSISMGAGLGSSASFGVCLASAFYFYSKMKSSSNFIDTFNRRLTNDSKQIILNDICEWAFCSEKIMHGNPSGLDNFICTFGGVVKFYKGAKPTTIEFRNPLKVLLVDSGVNRSTATLVQNVAKLKQDFPELVDHILMAMGSLTENVVEIFQRDISKCSNFKNLDRLVAVNNNLLRALGVSHQSLERIFLICNKYGFSGKITGAGGGGFAFVLLPEHYENMKEFKDLCDELKANEFKSAITEIGGAGMVIESC